MNTQYSMNRFLVILGSTLSGLMFATSLDAANPEVVVVEVTFVGAITISTTNPLQFGSLDVTMLVSETVVMNTDNSFTDSNSNVLGGTQGSADLTITSTPSVSINILADNVSLPGGADYTLDTFICSYEGAGDTGCSGGFNVTSVASGALRVGATLTGLGTVTAGNQDGSFDVTVTYQ